MGWKEYEAKRSAEVERNLNDALDAGDFEAFKIEYQEHAMRYIPSKRRKLIYIRFLKLYSQEVKNDPY